MMHRSQTGFTLIELSIVLIIIGLISGGILVGSMLISTAQVRRDVTRKEELDTAVFAFMGKYNCLPGDCANATALGFDVNGDGNGLVEGVPSTAEMLNFWNHLSKSQMAPGNYPSTLSLGVGSAIPGQHTPSLSMSSSGRAGWGGWCEQGNWVAYPDFSGNRLALMSNHIYTTDGVVGTIRPSDAYSFDAKIDDGVPSRGIVRGYGTTTNAPMGLDGCQTDNYNVAGARGADGPDSVYCMDTSSPERYNVNSSQFSCILIIKMPY